MKVSLYLSVEVFDIDADRVLERSTAACASMKFAANVFSMDSSKKDAESDNYHVESGARIDLLNIAENRFDDILYLWKRLQDVLGIHCVWLDIVRPSGRVVYQGCVIDWCHYRRNFNLIHTEIMKCLCETMSDNPDRPRNGKPLS